MVQYFRKEVWKPAGLSEGQLRRLVDLDAQYGHLQVTHTLSLPLSRTLPLTLPLPLTPNPKPQTQTPNPNPNPDP